MKFLMFCVSVVSIQSLITLEYGIVSTHSIAPVLIVLLSWRTSHFLCGCLMMSSSYCHVYLYSLSFYFLASVSFRDNLSHPHNTYFLCRTPNLICSVLVARCRCCTNFSEEFAQVPISIKNNNSS